MLLPYKLLSRKDIKNLDLPTKDMNIALGMFDAGLDVYLINETEDGYDLTYVLSPIPKKEEQQ